ncbi:MAG: ABC transporter substrate-binding protein, partial [Proteobacteria bacterium]|nr:ABC transporter substrate-binding protein [Pseudomonadota bacterium]
MKRVITSVLLCTALVQPAFAADKIKIGFLSTLSGPNSALGVDIRDAFNLAVKMRDGKLGGLPVEMLYGDDQLNPDQGKLVAERFIKRDHVDLVTGVVFSNVLMAVAPA